MKMKVAIPAVTFGVAAAGLLFLTHAHLFKAAVAAPPPPPIPVVAGVVTQHDVPIYRNGVGTVIAYNPAVVRAPIDGVVGVRQIDVGNIISPTTTNGLVVGTQLDPISLICTLPEGVLPQILRQQQATKTPLSVLAYNQDDTLELGKGQLALVNNEILQTTGSIQLKATFPNKSRELWPGEVVNARLPVTTRHNGLTVPASVVQQRPNGAYAYVITPDSTLAIRPLKAAHITRARAR